MTALQKNEARRVITLLNALYEARCKLSVTVEAGPDYTFSPEIQPRASTSPSSSGSGSSTSSSNNVTSTEDPDVTYAKTFPEAYQDATTPFRPNVSSYGPSLSEPGPPARQLIQEARRAQPQLRPRLWTHGNLHRRGRAFLVQARAQPAVGDVWGAVVGVRGARMVEAAAFVAAAVGDASRRAMFYRVDRSSELWWE